VVITPRRIDSIGKKTPDLSRLLEFAGGGTTNQLQPGVVSTNFVQYFQVLIFDARQNNTRLRFQVP
jgi:hypothetical protein